MREPSGHGIRGLIGRGCLFAFALAALFLGAGQAHAQAITRYVRDTGNINFVTTGGTMRTQSNDVNACSVGTSSSQALSGIPAGTTIRNAYLYWGGSGTTNDPNITFNGAALTATRTFATTVLFNSTSHAYFGHFANVTSTVAAVRNGAYTVGNFAVNFGNPWCNSSLVAGGWALIVIYESPTERLRAINVFDGLDSFYGSALTTVPDGFRVPPFNIDGRIGVFTLDGDPGNSGSIGAFSESLTFNTINTLDDGLNVPGSVPTVQQYDGTINTIPTMTSWGVDVDQYDISTMLVPGQTSGTLRYSAGGDVVVLMAQVVSATSDPAVDLGITASSAGPFISGGTGTYTINVSNAAGVEREDNSVSVTTTLPTGLSFNAGTGTGWTCSAAGQVVTCTHPPTLNAGATFPALSLVVNVAEAAAANTTVNFAVTSASFDPATANNTAGVTTATIDPSLATSTKTVQDVNGGEAEPGDILRYTVTLTESAGGQAVNVSMTDDVPINTTWSGFVSIPAGATSNFTAPTISVSNITVPANASVTVVFDVTVGNVPAGATIDNEATITNPNGADAAPNAPQVVVMPSALAGSGTKQLYLWNNPMQLSRRRPTGTHALISVAGNNASQTITLAPALQAQLTLSAGDFTVNLITHRTGTATMGQTSRSMFVRLRNSVTGVIATSNTQSFTSTTPTMRPFTLNTGGGTYPENSTFQLEIVNSSSATGRSVAITPYTTGPTQYSRVDLNSATIINVDDVQTWTQAFNGGAQQGTFYPGQTVHIRAIVSDPFGSFDISSATVTVRNPSGTAVAPTPIAMTAVGPTCNSDTENFCIFERSFVVPASPPFGGWSIHVTANEGVEGVFDNGVGSFVVALPQPSLTILKTSTVVSDPLNSATNPKRIPQSVVRYDITVTNSGPGTVDSGTLNIIDAIPANSSMYVSTVSGIPVEFSNGSPVSGLTYSYPTSVGYSNVGAAGPFTYTPVPDANGFDPAVRAFRVSPGGVMNATGGGNPNFTIRFRVRVN
jgi:uncharacterized repeat protein (TIGR01451 family)